MSQNLMLSEENTTAVMIQEFDENNSDVSEMLQIVDDVETRLIQEKIKEISSQSIKPPGFMGEMGVLFGILSGPSSLGLGAFLFIGLDFSLIPGIAISSLPFIAGMRSLTSYFKKDEKYTNQQEEMENLRKELVEKSLKGDVLEGGDNIGESWQEVLLSKDKDDDNAEVFKRYIRLVVDEETGFETVKSKKFAI